MKRFPKQIAFAAVLRPAANDNWLAGTGLDELARWCRRWRRKVERRGKGS